MIQVALIQKFILLLDIPTYALTVIIFSMLISSGAGQLLQPALNRRRVRFELSAVLCAVAASVAVIAFVAAPTRRVWGGIAAARKDRDHDPAGRPRRFPDGHALPYGAEPAGSALSAAVRWAWALNAASSVLGSAGAIFLAIYLGLRTTLLIGGAFYWSHC